ncbi:Alanine--tRNA ligase [uncultured archaeon]|nr:Alanine--tRNA ligase [uncultured archaeon]
MKQITREELVKKYLDFFKSKGHKILPSASLIPENDPTVLFTTAGMHPLVPYLMGLSQHPLGKKLCSVQKCIRTQDIDEVGDSYHHTFFEMLGNWSIGDYFKREAIEYSFEFITKVLKIPLERFAVSVFEGDKDAPRDEESAKIWESLGISKERVAYLPKENNWWGPAGKTGPCGPDTEMFYWKPNNKKAPKKFDPEDNNWVEIWNDVLMQYVKDEKEKYTEAKQKNIDTGMGVERTLTVLNSLEDNYLSSVWEPVIKEIEKVAKKSYKGNERAMRIVADHIKASVFIIGDGVTPSNKEQGYILRRLIRRAVNYGRELNMKSFVEKVAEPVFSIYKEYPELIKNRQKIIEELKKEEERFNQTIEKGLNVFNKLTKDKKEMDCKEAFLLYQSYGFPVELIEEECKKRKIKFSIKDFEKECQVHQELSRTASAGQFKSGLADNSEATTQLHTTAHLLMAALRIVLKDQNIMQRGSNITPERLRLDFNFPRKLTDEELKKIEELVNSQIQCNCEVIREEMPLEKAKTSGAVGVFENKYGEKVSVYTVKNPKEKVGYFSKEICAGPHVGNTCQLGKFKITKEEASSSGIRRIKAVLQQK